MNEHNGLVPLDHWIEEWERQSVIDYFDCHPLDGYRRLTFMMLDETWWPLDDVPGVVEGGSTGGLERRAHRPGYPMGGTFYYLC